MNKLFEFDSIKEYIEKNIPKNPSYIMKGYKKFLSYFKGNYYYANFSEFLKFL